MTFLLCFFGSINALSIKLTVHLFRSEGTLLPGERTASIVHSAFEMYALHWQGCSKVSKEQSVSSPAFEWCPRLTRIYILDFIQQEFPFQKLRGKYIPRPGVSFISGWRPSEVIWYFIFVVLRPRSSELAPHVDSLRRAPSSCVGPHPARWFLPASVWLISFKWLQSPCRFDTPELL